MSGEQFDILVRMAEKHETIRLDGDTWRIGRRKLATMFVGHLLLNGWIERHKESTRYRVSHKGINAVTPAA